MWAADDSGQNILMRMIPALRMLYCGDGLERVVFNADEKCEKDYCAEKNVNSDRVLYVNENDDIPRIVELFNEIKNTTGSVPSAVIIKNYGVVTPMKTPAETSDNAPATLNINKNNFKKRLQGKIAIVTGSAQGFGKGIAESLAEEGAHVVIADINAQGAVDCSNALNEKYGAFATLPVTVNVTDEKSVEAMVRDTVLFYGGLDIFVSNAGIVRSGNVFELSKENFDFVTAVNYSAFFLCAKYAAAVMKTQYETAPNRLADIIEINSKSGLEGSNKNFAYAGSKFGGLGLTQSFAMEFVEYGIKVNAVCPGNFLDGPLWADPINGLFKQYLDAGKVKGAKTIADVRKYYEDRVPMRRGCETADVARAIFYAIEQQYETGQAIPVTGGQVMLK